MTDRRREPIDPRPLARVVLSVQWACLAGESAMAITSAWTIGRVMSGAPQLSGGGALLVGCIGLAYAAAYLAAAFLTLKWIYRVNRNALWLAPNKTISPGWSVGWYFVPFANLVMPFRAMRETWQISHSPQNWRTAATPELLNWWWGLFLLSNILGSGSGRMSMTSDDPGLLLLAEEMSFVSSVLAVPLVLVLRQVVRRLTDAQAHALSLQAFDEPAFSG